MTGSGRTHQSALTHQHQTYKLPSDRDDGGATFDFHFSVDWNKQVFLVRMWLGFSWGYSRGVGDDGRVENKHQEKRWFRLSNPHDLILSFTWFPTRSRFDSVTNFSLRLLKKSAEKYISLLETVAPVNLICGLGVQLPNEWCRCGRNVEMRI